MSGSAGSAALAFWIKASQSMVLLCVLVKLTKPAFKGYVKREKEKGAMFKGQNAEPAEPARSAEPNTI